MNAIRIHKVVDSETLHLPELKPLIGKTVEIIVLEETPAPVPLLETMETFLALAPQEQPLDAKELEAMRQDPAYERFWPLLDRAGQDIIDVEAIVKLRAASTI